MFLTTSNKYLALFLLISHSAITKTKKKPTFQTSLNINSLSTYLTVTDLLWGLIWTVRLAREFRVFTPFDSKNIQGFNTNEYSYFFSSLRREKYYYALLKLKRMVFARSYRKRVRLRQIRPVYRRLVKQLYFIWACGRAYRSYRKALKKTTFSNFFISYDNFDISSLRRAILRFQSKKIYFYNLIKRKKRLRLRPWKFFNLRRTKIKARKTVVGRGDLRIKRFLRITGSHHFTVRYSNLLNRWADLFRVKGSPESEASLLYQMNTVNYLSPFKEDFLKDFGFYTEIFNVFFKRKKNNFYLTLTNGFGEVLWQYSSGRLLKFSRNKKIRSSMLRLPMLANLFAKRLAQKKVNTITKFYRPPGMSKRALKTIYNIFTRLGVVIKILVKNSRRPHGFFWKTKKVRRL